MTIADTLTPEQQISLLFEPCNSQQELQDHIRYFLKIDLPNFIVDEESTSTAMDFVWQVYHKMHTNEGPELYIVAAARNTAKTLTACIIRFYGMIHFRRSGTHLAANLEQASSATKYLDRFLAIPLLAPYIKTTNTREKSLTNLPKNSFTCNGECVLRVVTASIKGVNSQRGSLNVKDELDLVDPNILSEAAFIADPTQDEHSFLPIEINLSSRKTNSGPLQKRMDEAESCVDGTISLSKWSLVDWMVRCPSTQSLEDNGGRQAWINTENLRIVWDEVSYNSLSDAEKALQREIVMFDGCRYCPAAIVCQGRAVKQQCTSKMLRIAKFVGGVIKATADAAKIISQALNWKPESSAIIFRTFNRARHFKKPIDAYFWITGGYFNPDNIPLVNLLNVLKSNNMSDLAKITPTKLDIYKALRKGGWKIHYGIDWGYSPDPAVVVIVAFHVKQVRAVILHCEADTGYANQDWAEHTSKIWHDWPGDLVCPDMEDPASPSYFRKFKMSCRNKKPSRIETGVSQIRSLLWSPISQSERMIILDDGEYGTNKYVAECMEKWTHKKTPIGYDYTRYDEDSEYTHPLDGTRYALDPFISLRTIQVTKMKGTTTAERISDVQETFQNAHEKAMAQTVNERISQYFQQEHGITLGKPNIDTTNLYKPENIIPPPEPPPPINPKPKKKLIFSM